MFEKLLAICQSFPPSNFCAILYMIWGNNKGYKYLWSQYNFPQIKIVLSMLSYSIMWL